MVTSDVTSLAQGLPGNYVCVWVCGLMFFPQRIHRLPFLTGSASFKTRDSVLTTALAASRNFGAVVFLLSIVS